MVCAFAGFTGHAAAFADLLCNAVFDSAQVGGVQNLQPLLDSRAAGVAVYNLVLIADEIVISETFAAVNAAE